MVNPYRGFLSYFQGNYFRSVKSAVQWEKDSNVSAGKWGRSSS